MSDFGKPPTWLTRWRAVGLVAVVAGLIGWAVAVGSRTPKAFLDPSIAPPKGVHTDVSLYREIVRQVAAGHSYYEVAVPLQKAWNFPTRPSAAVRLPTTAELIAHLGGTGARVLLTVVAAAALLLLLLRFERVARNRFEWYSAFALVCISVVLMLGSSAYYLHECWAAAFILLSLAVRTDRRWWPAVVFATIAVMFRETALIYPAAMLSIAVVQRRWRESVGWLAGIAVFLGFYAWHVHEVAAAQVAHPYSSPTWLRFGGWPFIVDSLSFSSVLRVLPHSLAAVIVTLAMAGWLFARGPVALRFGVTAAAFAACFLVLGRPTNVYWAVLYVAVALPGLAFAPSGAVATWRVLTQRPMVAARNGAFHSRRPIEG